MENKFEFQFRKLITEYNAILIAMISLILGVAVFTYNISQDLLSSLLIAIFVFIFINEIRKDISYKIDKEIDRAR